MLLSLQKWLGRGIITIVAIMPFHAFLSIYLGKLTGQQILLQAWKETLILLMLAGGVYLGWKHREKIQKIVSRPLNQVIIAYMALSLGVTLALANFGTDFWFGIKVNLVFLVLFLLAQLVRGNEIEDSLVKIIILTTTLVATFGTLQVLVLPTDFLGQFGYNASTILPYHLVAPNAPHVRVLSTLGGPNQLGSFLILPIALMTWLVLQKRRFILIIPLSLSLFTLINTYSRSAWLGTLTALLIIAILSLRQLKQRLSLLFGALLLIGAFVAFTLTDKESTLRNLLWRPQVIESLPGSDNIRLEALQGGLEKVQETPLGRGLGEAGPASFQSDSALITENYYLQIAVESGVAGLLLFLVIMVLLAKNLYILREHSALAVPLLASLTGISVINLFLHGWADSSTALIFWAAAGTVLGEET